MKKTSIHFIFCSCLISFVFLLFLLVTFCLSIILFNREKIREKENTSKKYQVVQINPETNSKSVGFVSTIQSLDEEGFLYYEDRNLGEHLLISNYGAQEFQCRGICYCDDVKVDAKRRVFGGSSTLISKGLIYLVAAISSMVAYESAVEYMKKECQTRYSELCSSESSIRHDVEGCDDLTQAGPENLVEDSERNRKIHHFYCEGNCKRSGFLKTEKALQLAEEFDCETQERNGEIKVDCTDLAQNCNLYARVHFQRIYLTPFCKQTSETEYWYSYREKKTKKKISLCVGTGNGRKSTTVCRDIGFMKD